LYADGREVASGRPTLGRVSPVLQIAPVPLLPAVLQHLLDEHVSEPPASSRLFSGPHFSGKIAGFILERSVLTPAQIQQLTVTPPEPSLIDFEEGSKEWPLQTYGQAGYRDPQDPSTMPRSEAPFSQPAEKPLPPARTTLEPSGERVWTLNGGWWLAMAPKVTADGEQIARPDFNAKGWMPATVPGTVLTTLIDRGVYPDPDYGLNNLAIPESLNKQDYWYRAEFASPRSLDGRRYTLTFNGINYHAIVWLNGTRLGDIKGAFIRGSFDITDLLKSGKTNALAVRISPPPHPGIPEEESIKAGPGENGGSMCLDGPTFVATEGWDWIPSIRDRDTGIWQDVTLTATGSIKMEDPQVVTSLPLLPDTSRADVEVAVPLHNSTEKAEHGTVTATFGDIKVVKTVTIPPGESTVKLAPAEFPQLSLQTPRLWWPNGYGKPELYQLKLSFAGSDGESETKQLKFGIREITYELSLFDSAGHLRRMEVSPTAAMAAGRQIVDITHAGMREIPRGWAASLLPGAETSPAVKPAPDTLDSTDLVIKVNGVKIAARGGNWGMDDSRKRVSRERLEPYFRLHRDANLNIIRNWVGQNTEETFYELADEYGQMVWNDFWESTQNYNIEPQDPALFLANARDVIERYRNHPSIVIWCGRNEGVPQPIINEGLRDLILKLDGTRYYTPSSNRVNLRDSGPYSYREPARYYAINHGFSVELGIPSLSTLESFTSSIPEADQWPISDDWAYHDWHQKGNGDVAPFMQHLEEEFGAATNLRDFERKAQMFNFVDHRAIFEGFNAHLWQPNSGRMLWMTQSAWPSNMWEISSHDYDTQASFYGVKKACEPIHVQLDLSNYNVAVVNTTPNALPGLTVSAKVYSLTNKLLLEHQQAVNAGADALTPGFPLDLAPLLASGVVLVKLDLHQANGQSVSQNLYWLGADEASYRQLNTLPAIALTTSANAGKSTAEEAQVHVRLTNSASTAALAVKLTLEHASDGTRILPAYLSDNYVSLLPGESREIDVSYPAKAGSGAAKVGVRGWNVVETTIPVAPAGEPR
ncbi:MAG: glycosyl hydrolase 2 galactose-binding domain-containing protein, partial [Acidobacteriaceae bacterium]